MRLAIQYRPCSSAAAGKFRLQSIEARSNSSLLPIQPFRQGPLEIGDALIVPPQCLKDLCSCLQNLRIVWTLSQQSVRVTKRTVSIAHCQIRTSASKERVRMPRIDLDLPVIVFDRAVELAGLFVASPRPP